MRGKYIHPFSEQLRREGTEFIYYICYHIYRFELTRAKQDSISALWFVLMTV